MSRKINNIHTYYKEELKLSKLAEDIIDAENSKQSTKNPLRTNNWLWQGCKMQDQTQKAIIILYT